MPCAVRLPNMMAECCASICSTGPAWPAVPNLVVRMDVVLDGKPVGPAHFLCAEIGLAEAPAAHRVAEAGVLLPTPGVNIRLFGRQLNARGGPARALCAAHVQLSPHVELNCL